MKFLTLFSLFTFYLVFFACTGQDRPEHFQFDNPYKFNSEIEKKVREDTVSWKYQISAGEYASKGNFKNALEHWSKAFGGADRDFSPSEIDSIKSNYDIVSAKEYIVQQSKINKVIIINEAHHYSSHRVFTESLLQNLYNEGYRNLGVEALSNGGKHDSGLNERKYPIQASGYYIRDPNFGSMLRTALKIGYNVFAYEQTENLTGKEREIAQAKNIKKVMEQKPDEKFLIHCGFDHALEGEHKVWGKAMAGRLKEFTGVDPLTINQVKYSERFKPEFSHPLLKALNLKKPSILLNSDNKPLEYKKGNGWSDIAVLHPKTTFDKGRPQWLISEGKQLIKFKGENLDISYPIMVLAFKEGENLEEAVPSDIIEIQNRTDKSYLVLEKGRYNIVVSNKKNRSLKYELNVK